MSLELTLLAYAMIIAVLLFIGRFIDRWLCRHIERLDRDIEKQKADIERLYADFKKGKPIDKDKSNDRSSR
jgi:HAMP domain-containing protein